MFAVARLWTRSTVSTRSMSPVTCRMNSRPSGVNSRSDFERDEQRALAAEFGAKTLVGLVDGIVLRDPHA